MSDEVRNLRVRGIGVGSGVAIGPVAVLDRRGRVPRRRGLDGSEVEAEVERFLRAVTASAAGVETMRQAVLDSHGEAAAALLDPLLFLHHDPLLVERTADLVRTELVNAEHALATSIEQAKRALARSSASYFRERADDVEHVGQHVLRALAGEGGSRLPVDECVILVATDLSPADAAELHGSSILGLVTTTGSATSHTALMAHSLGIPAVVGARMLPLRLADGRLAVVDGLRGEVVVAPDDEVLEGARSRADRYRVFAEGLSARGGAPIATADGTPITVLANLDLPADVERVAGLGVAGVGLYRTEYLYLDRKALPDEDEQVGVYGRILAALAGRPLTLRTFDLGSDKLSFHPRWLRSTGATLGRSGLRFSLLHPDVLRTQMRAILRASALGPVQIMFPRVARRAELDAARELFDRCRLELEQEGVPVGEVPIGVMIEVPSAALLAEHFARAADFFSVGTNDLTQLTLAADRSDALLAECADPLDPSILRLLDLTAKAAVGARIPLSMCGDMAADPMALPVVLGLGYERLSIPCDAVHLVAEAIRRVPRSEAVQTAEVALGLDAAEAVRELVYERFVGRLGDLWEQRGVSARQVARRP